MCTEVSGEAPSQVPTVTHSLFLSGLITEMAKPLTETEASNTMIFFPPTF